VLFLTATGCHARAVLDCYGVPCACCSCCFTPQAVEVCAMFRAEGIAGRNEYLYPGHFPGHVAALKTLVYVACVQCSVV